MNTSAPLQFFLTHRYHYILLMSISAAAVLCFAMAQHLLVLDIAFADIRPRFLVIPATVGALFGFLIATVRLLYLEQQQHLAIIEARDRALRSEIEARERTAQREQRLDYAMNGANDGLWDWNIRTGEVYYSPRWYEMLGYTREQTRPTYEFWEAALHPEDKAEVLAALRAHLRGEAESFLCEFRTRDATGDWMWVLGRGKVVDRDENGEPVRAVGTQTDISERRRTTSAMESLLAGTANAVGKDFFDELSRNLASALEMDFALVGTVDQDDPQRHIQPLAVWPSRDFSKEDCTGVSSPCEGPAAGHTTIIESGLLERYPQDAVVRRVKGVSYFGQPVFDRKGRVIGLLAAIGSKPLPAWKKALATTLVPIFAARAAAEIERERTENALQAEKDRAQITLASIGDGVVSTDSRGRIEFMNPVAGRITGWCSADAVGRPFEEVCSLHREFGGEPEYAVRRCLDENQLIKHAQALKLVTRDGKKITAELTAAPIRDQAGAVRGAVVVIRDVTAAREMARQLTWQATHDALTGLRNRKEFERELQDVMRSVDAVKNPSALLYLDLDQFKVVNDTSGHSAGDELLRQLGVLLDRTIRQSDVLARLGGDEFGLILKGCDEAQAIEIAGKLTAVVRDFRFAWQDKVFEIGVSVGIVMLDGQENASASALGAADIACYAAKDLGRNRYHLYQPDDEELARRHGEMQWVSRIHKALAEDSFVLFAQDIILLEDCSVQLREVLVRMLDANGEIIPTGSFIPAAERFGIMPEIDRWVIDRAFRALAGAAVAEIVSINLSGLSLGDEKLVTFIRERQRQYAIRPETVCFEVTETAAIANLSSAVRFISELRADGFRFSLDDFGSGLSSFGYLKNLPVSYLKIDGSFVRDMRDDPIDRAMVHAINEIGHTMGIATIAEYVEDAATLEMLKTIGVDFAQGYHIDVPKRINP